MTKLLRALLQLVIGVLIFAAGFHLLKMYMASPVIAGMLGFLKANAAAALSIVLMYAGGFTAFYGVVNYVRR